MDEYLKSSIDSKILALPGHIGGFCRRNKIEVVDKNTFVMHKRKTILDYHLLTGDYSRFIKNILLGEAQFNEEQLEEYQRKDFKRNLEKLDFGLEGFLYTDIN